MKVRTVATVLWFVTGWSGAGIVVGLMGLPSSLALVGGIATAMAVWFDPTGRIWGRAPQRRVRPIEEVAAELDQRARGAGVEAAERA